MIKPKYIAIAAITVDGKIAVNKNHMSDWTSPEDKTFMRALLAKCDAVIVGNNTYKTAIKPLSKRNCIVFTKSVNRPVKKSTKLLYCNPGRSDIRKMIAELGYKKIALLGGAQTYAYFLKNNLLDEIYLTIEPLIFGEGINFFAAGKSIIKKLKLLKIKKLNNSGSILLHYKTL